jgi:hypothetical protein
MVSLGILLATVLASAPQPVAAPSPAAAPYDEARFMISVGGRTGGRFLGASEGPPAVGATSFGGGVGFGLGVRVWQGLYLEASLSESLYANPEQVGSLSDPSALRHFGPHASATADGHDTDTDVAPATAQQRSALLVGQILFGVRYEIRTAKTLRLRPSVFAGLTHLHEATVRDFQAAPGRTLLGISDAIRHRSGAQIGAGLRIPFSMAPGRALSRFSARLDADVAYYFDTAPGRLQAGLGLGVQVVF